MHAREYWTQPQRQSVPAHSQHSEPGEGGVIFEDRQFYVCTAEGRMAVPPLPIPQVSTEQACGIVLSHTYSSPVTQTVHRAVTLGPCARVAMSWLVSYCFSIAQSLGAKDSSQAVRSSQSTLTVCQEAHILLWSSVEVSLAEGEAVSQRIPHPARILRQHQTYPTPTLRSSVCPSTPQRPAGSLPFPHLQEQLAWVSPRPGSL